MSFIVKKDERACSGSSRASPSHDCTSTMFLRWACTVWIILHTLAFSSLWQRLILFSSVHKTLFENQWLIAVILCKIQSSLLLLFVDEGLFASCGMASLLLSLHLTLDHNCEVDCLSVTVVLEFFFTSLTKLMSPCWIFFFLFFCLEHSLFPFQFRTSQSRGGFAQYMCISSDSFSLFSLLQNGLLFSIRQLSDLHDCFKNAVFTTETHCQKQVLKAI